MMRNILLVWMATGCDPRSPAADLDDERTSLSRFEGRLLSEPLADIRAGVRPWSEDGLGICTLQDGVQGCPTFLGADAGLLPAGDHQVYAELRAPALGEHGTWTVDFQVACTVTAANGTTQPLDHQKSYTVQYTGESRGYRLAPLYIISSPSSGRRDCQWTLTAPHPDRELVYTGSWSTPAKEE